MEMNNLDSRIRLLSEMEKEYEGFNKAVRTVMQASERKALRGVRGPVANLMKVDKNMLSRSRSRSARACRTSSSSARRTRRVPSNS